MATILLNGNPIGVGGRFPRVGDIGHSFMLVDQGLKDVSLSAFAGRKKVLAVVPSLDAEIGIRIARRMEAMASNFPDVVFIAISVDTPYAQSRIKDAEGFRALHLLSTLRGRDFHKDYGVMITDYPLSGLMASAVVVMDEGDVVLQAELVPEINSEPNYEAVVKALVPNVES